MNWARLVFITLLPFGMIWPASDIVTVIYYFHALLTKDLSGGQLEFGILVILIVVVKFLVAAGLIVLLAWIIYQLASPAIREEFA